MEIKHTGRVVVSVYHNKKVKLRFIHQLVLETFVGPCPDGMECCHFPDKDPKNCKLSNLRWDTRESNARDRHIQKSFCYGSNNHFSKTNEETVLAIREYAEKHKKRYGYLKEICRRFNVTYAMAQFIVYKNNWRHLL